MKDRGVYMLSEKDEMENGRRKLIARALECNPHTVPFDDWWARARAEFGGDDFVEHFDHDDTVFDRVVDDGFDIHIRADVRYLYVNAVAPQT